ncbi:type III secretion system inner rod subunit SctI [Citrobacter sp. ANG330]|uniref:type III secretion system inner rod subunit SctI n=1 Tax=Citrobacter sp. ANG330 TaxID=3048142 RepID=UPI0039C35B71
MDVSAISGATLQSLPATDIQAQATMPDVHEVEAFKTMMAGAKGVPEENMVNAVQQQHAMFTDAMQKVSSVAGTDDMSGKKTEAVTGLLDTQYQLFNLSFSLDLTAKVAGQFSQAVNKLTTMQ